MGCGGSRADAIIEPRYHESWTRETESTWLTNTDVETPIKACKTQVYIFLFVKLTPAYPFELINVCSQQSSRDSKRRASKEASSLSKDSRSVSISSSGDAEPQNIAAGMQTIRRRPDNEQILQMMFASDFYRGPGSRRQRFVTRAPAYVSIQRPLDAALMLHV
uniref:BAALC binder of MAP3K1 and KLF4 b n=1 Tax=Kryptolebias marmoratus TaxID=37003 RepID=A0A3Q2ZWQ8_KRYMA